MHEDLSKLKALFGWLLFFACAAARATPEAVEPTLETQFDNAGLHSLKFGTELLHAGMPELQDFKSDPEILKSFDVLSSAFDADKQITTRKFNWGQIQLAYHTAADRLLIDLTIDNKSNATITQARFDLLSLQFPATPTGDAWAHRYGISYRSADDLPVLLADWGSARLALCSEDLSKPVGFGFQPRNGGPYAVNLWFREPIPAGESRTASLSIRLAGENLPGYSLASDVLKKFAEKYPSELNWTDRRPIGSAFLSTSAAGYKNNPRGWFLDRDLDTSTAERRAIFHTKLMNYEDQVIAHCKRMNAQGVIIWDLEGQEMPHATSYLADPRMLSKAAPEMDAEADAFFKRLTDAGLRTGVTIRPTRVERAKDGKGWTQVEVPDPVAEMDAKMSYATRRWGCSIFYCDSNVNFVRDAAGKVVSDPAMPAEDFQKLARKHKDALLIPEHKTARYWACTAPYSELRSGLTGTLPQIREVYPDAFTVLQVVDGPPLDSEPVVNTLTAAINGGDILLFRPWWDDPATAQIKQIYDRAKTLRMEPK
jgi:hypothetical protein